MNEIFPKHIPYQRHKEMHATGVGKKINQVFSLRPYLKPLSWVVLYGGVEGPPHIFFDIMLSHTDDIVTRP